MGHSDRQGLAGSDDARAADALVAEVLAAHGARVRQHLKQVLNSGQRRHYLDDLLADYPQRGGKMLRPCICMAAAAALGAEPDDAVATAVSIELMHNALLIHDDIEDDSDQRRGRPTLHALHGVPLALNAGDALGLLSLVPLKDNVARLGPRLAGRIFEETERMAWATAEGQALELGWQRHGRSDVSEEDYLDMVLLKTCWLTTIHPLRVGCLIGSNGRMDLDPLIRLGFFMGAAFQIQDDVLNLVEAPAYGKERNGDLYEGKRTLMLIHALKHARPGPRARLQAFLAMPRDGRSDTEVRWVQQLIESTGALDHARQVAAALAGAGLYEFDRIFAGTRPSRDLRFLRAVVTWVLQRQH